MRDENGNYFADCLGNGRYNSTTGLYNSCHQCSTYCAIIRRTLYQPQGSNGNSIHAAEWTPWTGYNTGSTLFSTYDPRPSNKGYKSNVFIRTPSVDTPPAGQENYQSDGLVIEYTLTTVVNRVGNRVGNTFGNRVGNRVGIELVSRKREKSKFLRCEF